MAVEFDWKNPDYDAVIRERMERLKWIRANPDQLKPLKLYYKNHIADFINDWGMTFDPRNVDIGRPAWIPFLLFPRQREWIDWAIDHWRSRKPGLSDKSRDSGLTWLAIALGCSLCVFWNGVRIGYGSRKEEYVDRIGDPKAILTKGRSFMEGLPVEFRAGWTLRDHAPHMRMAFPETGATITGEAGDNIGRGDRTSIYIVDESALLERPEQIDAALSQTTNCRLDISTPRGMGNSFATRRFGGKIDVFTFHWRDDPRKDDAWYQRQIDSLDDPVIIAQEIDIDYTASVEGVLIPSVWVRSAVDACRKLGIAPTGAREGAVDIADEGRDANAFAGAHGVELQYLEEWSGKGADIFSTVERIFVIGDTHDYRNLQYDADGLGAGVRGDARIINERRAQQGLPPLEFEPFRGSEAVVDPEGEDVKGRKNKDFFGNRKAQAWWSLRTRFQKTHRWITEGVVCDPDEIISISSRMPLHQKLVTELSQPTYAVNAAGKIIVDKTPDGAKSPNLADAVMIKFAPQGKASMKITSDFAKQFQAASSMRRRR